VKEREENEKGIIMEYMSNAYIVIIQM